MLAAVTKRQSDREPSVSKREQKAKLAAYVGERIRSAMQRRGWVSDDGRYEVKQLVAAVQQAGALEKPPRWQTVQQWIDGHTAPSTEYASLVAAALGMTLAELMGAAIGEPTYAAWFEFLATPLGESLTPAERQSLASLIWVHGAPDVAAYKMALAALRSTAPS